LAAVSQNAALPLPTSSSARFPRAARAAGGTRSKRAYRSAAQRSSCTWAFVAQARRLQGVHAAVVLPRQAYLLAGADAEVQGGAVRHFGAEVQFAGSNCEALPAPWLTR
jgi:hypothetical protein